jgi:hypothetical protein
MTRPTLSESDLSHIQTITVDGLKKSILSRLHGTYFRNIRAQWLVSDKIQALFNSSTTPKPTKVGIPGDTTEVHTPVHYIMSRPEKWLSKDTLGVLIDESIWVLICTNLMIEWELKALQEERYFITALSPGRTDNTYLLIQRADKRC